MAMAFRLFSVLFFAYTALCAMNRVSIEISTAKNNPHDAQTSTPRELTSRSTDDSSLILLVQPGQNSRDGKHNEHTDHPSVLGNSNPTELSTVPSSSTSDEVTQESVAVEKDDGRTAGGLVLDPTINSFENLSSSCSVPPSQRICGCTSVCIQLNNCCYDSDFMNVSVSAQSQYSCYERYGNRFIFSTPSRLIDTCLPSWEDPLTQQRCEASNPDDYISYIPCYSEESALAYKNVYCLECNDLSDCLPWQLTYHSPGKVQFKDVDTFDKMIAKAGHHPTRGAYFLLTGYDHLEPKHCAPFATGKCRHEFAADSLTNLCRAYYSPVLIRSIFYRNIYCVMCSRDNKTIEIEYVSGRSAHSSFSILLNVHPTTRNNDGNQPTISRIRGYERLVTVVATTRTRKSRFRMDNAINQRIMTIASQMLWLGVNSTLPDLRAEIGSIVQHDTDIVPSFRLSYKFIIREELPVENISAIQRSLISLHFEFNITDTVSVSCCTYENNSDFDIEDGPRETTTLADPSGAPTVMASLWYLFLLFNAF